MNVINEHNKNARGPIVKTDDGISIILFFIKEHPIKASDPIYTTEDGIIKYIMLTHPLKAFDSIEVIV